MSTFNIAVTPGDYIGPEVVAEARKVLEAVGRRFGHTFVFKEALAGGAAYDAYGEHLPQSTLDICAEADAIIKGPFGGPTTEVNHPKWQGVEQNAILPLRKYFDLYLNLRPVVVPDALLSISPVKEEIVRGTDMLILRELTSGIYFGPRGSREVEGPRETPEREVWDTELYRTSEIERMTHDAFRLAGARRKKVTLIAKSNVMSTGVFWREVVEDIARQYPDIALDYQHVDNASMQLITNPRQYDVMLTSNIIGDILSDEASVLSGLDRHGAVGVAEREGFRPVRAHPRLGTGHRGPGQGQPHLDDPQRGHDAAALLPAPERSQGCRGRGRRRDRCGRPHAGHRARRR